MCSCHSGFLQFPNQPTGCLAIFSSIVYDCSSTPNRVFKLRPTSPVLNFMRFILSTFHFNNGENIIGHSVMLLADPTS